MRIVIDSDVLISGVFFGGFPRKIVIGHLDLTINQ